MAQKPTEIAEQLRNAAKQLDPAARAAVELVRLLMDEAKDSLVTTSGDDMLRSQGAARMLTKLHTLLTREPPQIQKKTGAPE